MSFDLREWQVRSGNWNRLNEILGLLGTQEVPSLKVTTSGVIDRDTDVTSSAYGDITLNYDTTQFEESPAETFHLKHHTIAADSVTITQPLIVLSTTTPQFQLKYDGNATAIFSVDSNGDLTINASGGGISFGNESLLTTGTGTLGELVVDNININGNTINSISSDTIMTSTAGNICLYADIKTDRWLELDGNTFIGIDVISAGNLAHSTGTEGWYNTGIGNRVFYHITTGYNNCAVGTQALFENTTGYSNLAFGVNALQNNTVGFYNIAIGINALLTATEGNYNVAFGYSALRDMEDGDYNLAIGADALRHATTESYNIAIGRSALTNVDGAHNCVGIGDQALLNVSSGLYNVGIGSFTLGLCTTGNGNIAMGHYALAKTVSTNYNIGFIWNAGYNNTGSYNIYMGERTGYNQGSGSNNVMIGRRAGEGASAYNASSCIFLGYRAGRNETNSNRLYIAVSDTATPLIYGEFDNTLVRIGGHLELIDNNKVKLGTGKDVEIYYDSANLVIDSSIVAASDLNIQCGTDKTLELQETVWKDINIGGVNLSKPAASQPDEDDFVDEGGVGTGITTLAFAVGEKASSSLEIQHDYKEGTDFVVHVHWQGIAAPTGTDNVQWRLTYALARVDVTLDSATIVDSPDTAFDTQYEFKRTDIVTIDGSTAGVNGGAVSIGDQFLFTLERVAATGDAYAGDALVATVGIHYEIDTLGSRQMLVK